MFISLFELVVTMINMLCIYARLGVNISLASVSGIEKNILTQKWLNLLYLPWNVLNEQDPGK